MNVGDIKNTIAAYLQVPVADTVKNGVDLCLFAMNNAKKYAERLHDWECEKVVASGTAVDGVGTWATGMLVDSVAVRLKQPQTFYLANDDGSAIPLYHHSKKHGAVWAKERIAARGFDRTFRYQGDISYSNSLVSTTGQNDYRYEVFVQGNGYTIAPEITGSQAMLVDGHKWLDDYVNDTDEDFFTEHGSDYLLYSSIVELNLIFQVYIPQTEGNLSPPDRARDDALAGLIEHDNFIVESGRQPFS